MADNFKLGVYEKESFISSYSNTWNSGQFLH